MLCLLISLRVRLADKYQRQKSFSPSSDSLLCMNKWSEMLIGERFFARQHCFGIYSLFFDFDNLPLHPNEVIVHLVRYGFKVSRFVISTAKVSPPLPKAVGMRG